MTKRKHGRLISFLTMMMNTGTITLSIDSGAFLEDITCLVSLFSRSTLPFAGNFFFLFLNKLLEIRKCMDAAYVVSNLDGNACYRVYILMTFTSHLGVNFVYFICFKNLLIICLGELPLFKESN